MANLNISVVFNRQNNLKKNGTAQIEVCACFDRKRKYFGTGICVKPEAWDNKKKRIKPSAANAIQLNKQINDLIQRLEDCYLARLNTNKPFTLENLTELMQGKDFKYFTDFVRYEIDHDKTNAESTRIIKRVSLRTLKGFQSDILFDELTFDFMKKLENHLLSLGQSTNTRHKFFRHLKTWINSAINKNYMELNKYPFRQFHAPTEKTNREYLEPGDISRLELLEFEPANAHLQKIKDMYLFACYTGLRFSDVSALSKDCIKKRPDGLHLEMTMQKTNENINLPIYLLFKGKPIELLKRYEKADRKYYFDELTNQYVNRALKEIATLANINKKITFHTARHTTATFLVYKGLPITTIQKILGHKKLQTTQIYSKVIDLTVISELKNIKF
jgi:integrase